MISGSPRVILEARKAVEEANGAIDDKSGFSLVTDIVLKVLTRDYAFLEAGVSCSAFDKVSTYV